MICLVPRTKTKKQKKCHISWSLKDGLKQGISVESVKTDPHICTWEISSKPALSLRTVHKILHDSLHMRKLSARWITHTLTDIQKASKVHIADYPFNLFEPNGPKRLTDVVK